MKLFDRTLIIETFNNTSSKPALDEMDALYKDIRSKLPIKTLIGTNKVEELITQLKHLKQDYKDKNYPKVINGVNHIREKVNKLKSKEDNDLFEIINKSLFFEYLINLKNKSNDAIASLSENLERFNADNFNELVNMFIERIPSLKTYKKFNNDKGSYSGVEFQKIKNFGKQTLASRDKTIHLKDLVVVSEFKLSYRYFNEQKWFYIDFKNEIHSSPDKLHDDPVIDDLTRRVLFMIERDMNEKFSYYREIPIKDSETFPQQELDNIINEMNKKTFEFDAQLEKSFKVIFEQTTPINEALYNQGGVLLLFGQPLEDGTRRLYVTIAKQLTHQNRVKSDNTAGLTNRNVTVSNNIYRLSMGDGRLRVKGVAWSSPDNMKKALGLNGNNVGLHYNKTPMHQQTLQFNSIEKMLNNLYDSIIHIPNVRWQG